jgi:hypothetical protein
MLFLKSIGKNTWKDIVTVMVSDYHSNSLLGLCALAYYCCDKWQKNSLKEERFILALGGRIFSLWPLGLLFVVLWWGRRSWPVMVGGCSGEDLLSSWEKEREREREWLGQDITYKVIPPLLKTRLHLLMFPPPPKIASPAGNQVFHTWSLGTFHIQTVTEP